MKESTKMKTVVVAKLNLVVSLIVIFLIFTSQCFARLDPKTALGIWLMDSGEGEVAKDLSENENDGEIKGEPEWVKGKFGKALKLDGSERPGDYVKVTTSESLDSISEQVTLAAWVKLKKKKVGGDASYDHGIITFEYNCILNVFGPGRGANEGRVEVGATTLEPKWISCPNVVDDDTWHHIAFTYDGKAKKIYVDGIVVAEQPTNGSFNVVGKDLMIGCLGGDHRFLTGVIDEAAVFNVALTEDDIKNIMEKGLSRALGITAVSPKEKLASSWGKIKAKY